MSVAEGLEIVRRARERGQTVYAETCPQYLTVTEEILRRTRRLGQDRAALRTATDLAAFWRESATARSTSWDRTTTVGPTTNTHRAAHLGRRVRSADDRDDAADHVPTRAWWQSGLRCPSSVRVLAERPGRGLRSRRSQGEQSRRARRRSPDLGPTRVTDDPRRGFPLQRLLDLL